MNNLTQALKNHFRQITYTLLTASMLLALGVSGVQAQDDDDPPVPDAMPSQFYFQVGDQKTNDITLAPGENFTLKVGFTLIGPCDGTTITLLWHPNELTVPGTQVTNLVGSLLPFGFWNVITQSIGHLSFTQAVLGSYLLPPPDGQGGYEETDYLIMEFQVNVPEDATWSSTTIRHQINADTVDYSAMAFYGTSLVDYENIPTFTVFNSEAAAVDCPDLGLNIGEACDDGDDTTENDVVTEDCECAGTPIVVFDCPTLEANIGDTCDDGDSTTENDMINSDCECAGTPIVVFDCPALEANIGDACDDGDSTTDNDMINGDCECAGTPIVVEFDCPLLEANIGDACDDGDSTTENDMINSDCECAGTPIVVEFDCPALEANIGDACDDGDSTTENDMINSECECAGTPIVVEFDCPALEANIGDACDDNNSDTENDMITEDCACMGTPIVTFDCPALEANIGDMCDDNNADTENDMVNEDCICMGTPIVVEYDCPDLEANFGDACENEDGMAGVIDTDCNCYVAPPVFDCPDLQANYGDACELADGMGILNNNCECVPAPSCENYTYYLADHAAADGISDIYEVKLSGGSATMTYIATSEIEVHIAFNAADNNIYAVSKHENSYRTLNPLSGVWGPTVMLGADYGEITAAVFAPDELGVPNGKLVFGSQDQNAIFSLNVGTNVVSPYDSYSPVTGGDFAYTSDGMLYMATRSGNGLYEVYPAPTPDVLLGNVPAKVTGLAATDGDQLLLSAQGMMSLELYNSDGTNASSYALTLDGVPYTLRDGDLASGCNTREILEVCQSYNTYYVNHGPDVEGSDLYKVDFVGGNANLTYITNVGFEAHITYDAVNDKIYFVNKNGSSFIGYNIGLSTFDPIATPIAGGGVIGSQITAVAFNNGLIYVGDAGSDVISTIDLLGNPTYYASAPVFGGDLTWVDGVLYLANRSQSTLYKIEFGTATALGSIPNGVNGMAAGVTPGNLVTSSAAGNDFVEITTTGTVISVWPAMLGGEIFTFINGDMASGCIDDVVGTDPLKPIADELQGSLTAYPNPTSGPSTVVFTTGQTSTTLVEVYDMSGRNVATLFNQVAQQGQEYRLDFNGAALPNGVYIYRMTTQNETIIEKFMIAK